MTAQNPAVRVGAVKRLDARVAGWAPALVASPFAMTALGAQRVITRCSSPACAATRRCLQAHSNPVLSGPWADCRPTRASRATAEGHVERLPLGAVAGLA